MGFPRQLAENYLTSKAVHFERRCPSYPERTACDSFEIGTEPSPWYCSRSVVFIEFQFSTGTNHSVRSDPPDPLETIALARQLQDCL